MSGVYHVRLVNQRDMEVVRVFHIRLGDGLVAGNPALIHSLQPQLHWLGFCSRDYNKEFILRSNGFNPASSDNSKEFSLLALFF